MKHKIQKTKHNPIMIYFNNQQKTKKQKKRRKKNFDINFLFLLLKRHQILQLSDVDLTTTTTKNNKLNKYICRDIKGSLLEIFNKSSSFTLLLLKQPKTRRKSK